MDLALEYCENALLAKQSLSSSARGSFADAQAPDGVAPTSCDGVFPSSALGMACCYTPEEVRPPSYYLCDVCASHSSLAASEHLLSPVISNCASPSLGSVMCLNVHLLQHCEVLSCISLSSVIFICVPQLCEV